MGGINGGKMQGQANNQTVIDVPTALKWVGITAGVWAILVLLTATLTYIQDHPGFSLHKLFDAIQFGVIYIIANVT
jgi:hypothetical protein